MILLPYLLALLTGYLLLEKLTPKDSQPLSLSLKLVLGFGLGLGICGSLTFLTFFILRKFYPAAIIMTNLTFLIFLISTSHRQRICAEWITIFSLRKLSWSNVAAGILWSVLAFFYYYIATKHPFGQWDAWGMWNLKTKFLILSENPWRDILQRLHPHTHPDYPLLLPFINVWGMSFLGNYSPLVPFTTSLLFALLTPLLLFTGLKMFIPKPAAFFAATILFTHPYAAFWATAQYADVVLAFYLTAVALVFFTLIRSDSIEHTKLLGIILGLTAFTKNEGLLLVVLFSVITLLSQYLIFKPKEHDTATGSALIRWLIIGCVPVILFKTFLSPSNQDILPQLSVANKELLDPNKFSLIMQSFLKETLDQRWCFVWVFLLILFISNARAFFRRDTLSIAGLLITYFLIVAAVYQSSSMEQLSWWLGSSLRRLYFALLPLSLFLCFYTVWHPADKK